MKKKKQKVNIALGIGLAIFLFALVNLGVNTFYSSPQYEDYCTIEPMQYADQTTCEFNGGKWYPSDEFKTAYCDAYYTCNAHYDDARGSYNNNIFYVFMALGLILAVAGFYIKKNTAYQITALATGLTLIIEGIVRNYENKIPSFIAGVIAFVIVAYFVKRFNK